MSKLILKELKSHAPFTLFKALTGLILMFLFQGLSSETSHHVFYTLHPIHVVLSALITASMYKLHNCRDKKGKCNPWILLVIGYVGSIGIATMSDSLIPYIGEILLHMPNKGVHIGFIERWWLVNPLAITGVVIAYFWPKKNSRMPDTFS